MVGLSLFNRKGVDYVVIFDTKDVSYPQQLQYQLRQAAEAEEPMHFADHLTVLSWTQFCGVLHGIRSGKLIPDATRFTELP